MVTQWAQISNDSPTVADALDRGVLVERIADIVDSVPPPFTLGLYGGWGSGKSSIMKLVRRRLDPPRDGRPLPAPPRGDVPAPPSEEDLRWRRTVWFNAWEHQRDTDPAVALLQEAQRMLRPSWWNRWRMRKWFRILRDAIGPALEKAGPTAVVGGPLTALRQSAEQTNRDLFAVQEDQVRKREAFTEIVNLLARRADGGRIIIFVDDLDRCGDDAAVRLLDDIKTYLDHPRCVFVVGVNSAKLRAQRDVQHKDAQRDDAQGAEPRGEGLGEDRLDKIINYPFYVPPLEKEQYDHFVVKMLKEKFGWEGASEKKPPDHRLDVSQVQKVADILKEVLASRSASVRETVRLCNVFIVNHELVSKSFGNTGLWGDYRAEVVAVLSAVQAFHPGVHEWLGNRQDVSQTGTTEASAGEKKLRWLFGGGDFPEGGKPLKDTEVLNQARTAVQLVAGRERLPLYLSMWGHPHQQFARPAESRWDYEYRARQDLDLDQKVQWIRSTQGLGVKDPDDPAKEKLDWEEGDLRVVKLGDYWWWIVKDEGGALEQQISDLKEERKAVDGEQDRERERAAEIDNAIADLESRRDECAPQGPRALLLSEGLVATMKYDEEVPGFEEWNSSDASKGLKGALWGDSTLRRWLQADFFKSLPEAVRDRILEHDATTEVDWIGQSGFAPWVEKIGEARKKKASDNDPVTNEKIFLLKYEEIFGDEPLCKLGVADRDARTDDGVVGFWWLRSPGNTPYNAWAVLPSALAGPDTLNISFWAGAPAGVRPAFWLNLKS